MESQEREADVSKAPPRAHQAGVLLVLSIGFVISACFELIGLDEGYYLTAGVLTFQGKVPYRDFFFTQTPLSPYLFGLWLRLVGEGWYQARALGALCTIAVGHILFRSVYTRSRSLPVSWWCLLLYAGSALVHEYFVIAKTFSMSALAMLAAYLLLESDSSDSDGKYAKKVFLAGILAGLAIDLRLMFAAAVAVMVLPQPRKWLAYGLGIVAALLPFLPLYLVGPEQFVFNNWGFHAVRSSEGLIGGLDQKWRIFAEILGFSGLPRGESVQNLLVTVVVLWAILEKSIDWRAFSMVLTLTLINLLPTPTFSQYHCVCLPFLVLALIPWCRRRMESRGEQTAVWVLMAVYLLALLPQLGSSYGGESSWWPTAIGAYRRKISTHQYLIKTIQEHSTPEDLILVSCPGYAFGTGRAMVPMTENNFPHSLQIFSRITEAEANKYRVLTDAQTEAVITNRIPKVVVLGEGMVDNADYLRRHAILKNSGYRLLWTRDALTPYVRADGKSE